MIKNSKQVWEVGQKVNVGFVKGLEVIRKIPTPGDGAPDAYELKSSDGKKVYRFTPHNGLERHWGYGQVE